MGEDVNNAYGASNQGRMRKTLPVVKYHRCHCSTAHEFAEVMEALMPEIERGVELCGQIEMRYEQAAAVSAACWVAITTGLGMDMGELDECVSVTHHLPLTFPAYPMNLETLQAKAEVANRGQGEPELNSLRFQRRNGEGDMLRLIVQRPDKQAVAGERLVVAT